MTRCRPTRTHTDTTNRCCAATAGAPPRTPPAYLLPHLRPGQSLLDVGCGPGNITVDLAARVAPGAVLGIDAARRRDRRRDRGEHRARPGDVRGRRRLRARRTRRHLRRRPRAPGAAAPLGSRSRRCARCGASPSRVASSRRATATTPRSRGRPTRRCSSGGTSCTTRSRRTTRPRPTPAATCSGGRSRPGSPTSSRRAPPGRTPTPSPARGGVASGPTASSQSSFAEQAVEYGYADPAELAAIASAWRTWAEQPDGWFAVLHGEILARG